MANTRQGDLISAIRHLSALEELLEDDRLRWITVWDIDKSRRILEIAVHALAGEISAARGDYDHAIDELTRAVELEDALNYDEPPTWHAPMRQYLGAVLLDAGRPADAEHI